MVPRRRSFLLVARCSLHIAVVGGMIVVGSCYMMAGLARLRLEARSHCMLGRGARHCYTLGGEVRRMVVGVRGEMDVRRMRWWGDLEGEGRT